MGKFTTPLGVKTVTGANGDENTMVAYDLGTILLPKGINKDEGENKIVTFVRHYGTAALFYDNKIFNPYYANITVVLISGDFKEGENIYAIGGSAMNKNNSEIFCGRCLTYFTVKFY